MNKLHRYSGIFVACLAILFPLTVSAHASPVHSDPKSSASIETAPQQVIISFSERVDEAASSIKVTGPSGDIVSIGQAHLQDPRVLSIPVKSDGNGTYIVSWSVVSADDGHFTKGAYPFAVGAGVRVDERGAADTEMVQISTVPEALSIAIELTGNGFILGIILIFIFAVRPIREQSAFSDNKRLIVRGYLLMLGMGAILVFTGAAAQIIIKSQSLAVLRTIDFRSAAHLYVHTVAGAATVYRMVAVALVATLGFIGIRHIVNSVRVTSYEIMMIASMAAFEYYRAVISHATANPFYPHLSVAVNFVHLIEKDFWAGAAGILLFTFFSKRLWSLFATAIPRIWTMLALDLVAVSVTACYIVWLHLKSFGNLFSTQWGVVFIQLLIVAVLLVAARLYHVFSRLYQPQIFIKYLPVSLAAEFAFGLLVVYCSSLVIITSPPLSGDMPAFRTHDQGVTISLATDPYEDGMFMLDVDGVPGLQVPAVTLNTTDVTGEDISVDLIRRSEGGYVFPTALLTGSGPFVITVTVPQSTGYDAHAQFTVPRSVLAPVAEGHRGFDTFTQIMVAVAIASLIFALIVYLFSVQPARPVGVLPRRAFPELIAFSMFVLSAFFAASVIRAYGTASLSNPYKFACESDGNMWHLMLPTRAGVPVAQTPHEGCMWGMGKDAYQFPDQREYEYLSSLGTSTVTMTMAPYNIVAQQPVALTFELKNIDGTPATLLVDMEKYLHVVIVSEDESVFAHIHPDDVRPLTVENIAASTFTAEYIFPKAGTYLVSVDYAHGTQLESRQFKLTASGVPAQSNSTQTYQSPGMFGGYEVSLDYSAARAGEVTTLRFNVVHDGAPVTDMQPYLSAIAHISIIKNDLSAFIHTHGEIHPPGVPLPPIVIKNGQLIHSMSSMTTPSSFGPAFESHALFPSRGRYTVWVEFKVHEKVIPASFTVDVE